MPRPSDYDDDDYLPPAPRETKPRKSSGWLIAGLIVGAFILAGVGWYQVRVSRRTEQIARIQAEQNQRIAMEAAAHPALAARGNDRGSLPPGAAGANWEKVIGTWRREPLDEHDTRHPFQFEFRRDQTATVTHLNSDRPPIVAQVEVLLNPGDSLAMRLYVPGGMYSFRLLTDDTLVLADSAASVELPFARVK